VNKEAVEFLENEIEHCKNQVHFFTEEAEEARQDLYSYLTQLGWWQARFDHNLGLLLGIKQNEHNNDKD